MASTFLYPVLAISKAVGHAFASLRQSASTKFLADDCQSNQDNSTEARSNTQRAVHQEDNEQVAGTPRCIEQSHRTGLRDEVADDIEFAEHSG